MSVLGRAYFFIIICTGVAFSVQRIPEPGIDSLLTVGIDQTLKQNYREARNTFRILSAWYPDHPSGYLFQAAVLQAVAMDYEQMIQAGILDSLLQLANVRSNAMIEDSPQSSWGYFYRGTASGFDSFARSQRGDWFGAATRGLSSAGDFQKAIDFDSSFYDAFAGIGTYFYWKTRKIEFLTWLPFIRDRREEGIKLLKLCVRKGQHNRFAAISSLISVFLDAGRYDEAERFANEALEAYPENRIFLWGLATACDRKDEREEAMEAYRRLLSSMENDTTQNSYNELVCRLNMLKLMRQSGDAREWDVVSGGLEALHSREFPAHLKDRADEKFEEAAALLSKARQ